MRSFRLPAGTMAMVAKLDGWFDPIKESFQPIETKAEGIYYVGDFHFDPVSVHNGTHDPDISGWSKRMADKGYTGIIRQNDSNVMWLMVVPYSAFEVK